MKKNEDARFLFDPYLEWVKGEGVPVVEDFGIDLKPILKTLSIRDSWAPGFWKQHLRLGFQLIVS